MIWIWSAWMFLATDVCHVAVTPGLTYELRRSTIAAPGILAEQWTVERTTDVQYMSDPTGTPRLGEVTLYDIRPVPLPGVTYCPMWLRAQNEAP